MNKVEYMAMSLPYGLKVLRGDNITILKVSGIDIDCNSVLFTEKNTTTYGNISHSKPILRPISDLKDDYWFDKIESFACDLLDAASVYNQNTIDKMDFYKTEFAIIIKLVEWHFDICGLIESGEAVDYHTRPDFVF